MVTFLNNMDFALNGKKMTLAGENCTVMGNKNGSILKMKKNILSLFFLFIIVAASAQLNVKLTGEWVLDSVQIWNGNDMQKWEEKSSYSLIQTGYKEKFAQVRLPQFTLQAEGKASYVDVSQSFRDENTKKIVSNARYSVKTEGENYQLIIESETEIKLYNVTVLSDNQILLTYSFNGEKAWKFYYSKNNLNKHNEDK